MKITLPPLTQTKTALRTRYTTDGSSQEVPSVMNPSVPAFRDGGRNRFTETRRYR